MLAAPLLLLLFVPFLPSSRAQLPNQSQNQDLPLATNGQPFPWNKVRLPKTISPVHYDLTIHPNLTTLDFTGVVRIQLDVHEDTNTIVLHVKEMQIYNVWLLSPEGVSLLQVFEYPKNEQLALWSDSVLTKGRRYEVLLQFAAKLSDSFHGFYKSTYTTSNGEVRVLASTQFESTSARAAFPCFDEPAFKAKFTIRIVREPRHNAISNMPKVKTVELPGGLLEDHFDTTVKMSTYLVAYIVSDFLSKSKITNNGVEIFVYAAPDKIDQTAFALDAAANLLDFYDDYFEIPYPLPKQVVAAIPDFQAGAMENWGLTTYRETALLYDPEKSSASDKLNIGIIIAHELAHQWFGDLVTMKWWNDLWLNEGFAQFMETLSVNEVYPQLQAANSSIAKCFAAMEGDSLSSSHAISTDVETPAEIGEMFDSVVYGKGSCVLNMLWDFLSPEVFQIGIIRYLKRYSYQNTETKNLWESLTNVCSLDDLDENQVKRKEFCSKVQSGAINYPGDDLDVGAIMNMWTGQAGFPLVTVDVRGREVRLSQERYLKGDKDTEGTLWQIPLTYKTSASDTVEHFLLKTKTDVLYLPKEVDWVKFNVDMNGFYMVHYSGEGWNSMINLLKKDHTALTSNDRASLINNVFQLVSTEEVSLDTALDMSLYLSKETEYMPVTQGLARLSVPYKMMEKRDMKPLEKQMKGYVGHLFRGLIDQQEWTDTGSVAEQMLRSSLLDFSCSMDQEPCVTKATKLFQQWMDSDGNMDLPVDVTTAVFKVGARTPEGWDFLLKKYRSSLQASEKSRMKTAMAASPLKDKLQWMLDQSLMDDVMKAQDLPSVLISVSRNPDGHKVAWNFLKDNWGAIIDKFDSGSITVANMVTGVTNQYSTKEMLDEVQSFFDTLTVETGSEMRCIHQAKETIKANIHWMDTNVPLLQAWLNKLSVHEEL